MSGLVVECSRCGAARSMLGSTATGGLRGFQCQGERPWLGKEASEPCKAPPRGDEVGMIALQRGASNVYFPEVASSILIPPYSSRVHRVLRERVVWRALSSHTTDGRVPDETFRTVAAMRGVDAAQLRAAYEEIQARGGSASETALEDETAFRAAEYKALHQDRRTTDDLLACRPQDLSRYGRIVRDWFSNVTLVERLAETRALTGFQRITPGGTVSAALSKSHVDWLPAFRVQGEGIFLALRTDVLGSFRKRYAGNGLHRFLERCRDSGRSQLELSSELLLLHSLAHVLIKRLSYEAGYGASSIRERVYVSGSEGVSAMAGILLYTAAGDADGTMGGLVGLGGPGNLEGVIVGALREARWCAADPICRESTGQGPDSLNLAACHACALLPETSCEMQNRFLDRASVIAFFEGSEKSMDY